MMRRLLIALGLSALVVLASHVCADTALPPDCLGPYCVVSAIDDGLKAKLAAEKNKSLVSISFRTGVQQAQFATIAKLPWLQSLDVSKSKGIVSLAPLAGLTALTSLDLRETSVSDYKDLAHLASLKSLLLAGPTISSLAPLAGLTKLETLQLGDLDTDVDLAPLATCASLKELELEHDRWKNLDAVTQLQELSLELSTTSTLNFTAKMTKLRNLRLYNPSSLEKIDPLSLSSLEVLILSGADELRDVSGMSGLTSLKTLLLSATRVTSIAALTKLTHLESVDIGRTKVTDLTPLLGSASTLTSLSVPFGTSKAQLAPFKKANPSISIATAEPFD